MNMLTPAVTEVKACPDRSGGKQHNTVKLYWQGFDAYVNLQPLEDMSTPGERRGWWAACEAEAEAVYLSKAVK